jgi:hypothetical protein
MNTAARAPSPNIESADVSEAPRKKSIPPPLPRRDSAPPPPSGFLRSGAPAGVSGGSLRPLILSPTPIEAPEPHHRWSNWTKLISIGTVALLVTSMLIRSHEGSGEPQTPQAVLASEPSVVMSRQVIELDEVLIEGALYDKENTEGNVAFDAAAASSSIRSVGASSDECGPEASAP